MCRVSHYRALGMFEQSTGSGQVQIELQRRRRAAVQGTQNGQTPLDAPENAKRQVLAMRKGQWRGKNTTIQCFRFESAVVTVDFLILFFFLFGTRQQAFQSVLSFSSKEIIALTCSWCKLSVHNKTACFNDTKMNEPCSLGKCERHCRFKPKLN